LICVTNIHAQKLCNGYELIDDSIEFTDNEKLFICGAKSQGWRSIPKNQSDSYINTFLANRGYYQSTISNKKIIPNERSYIKKIKFLNYPDNFTDLIYAESIGDVLTEANIKIIESWTINRLDSIGYPCATVSISASYLTGEVQVNIASNDQIYIKEINRENMEQLNIKSYTRHDAIKESDLYNTDYLTLTSRRMMRSNLASYSYFTHSCKNKGVVNQKVIINKPNIIIFGVGASTEEFPIFKASWKNSRVDNMGSNFNVELYLSSIEKSLELSYMSYLFEGTPAFSSKPYIRYENIDERIFKTDSKIAGVDFSYNQDIKNYSLSTSLIPSLTLENQVEGEAPGESKFVSIEANAKILSHYHEFFKGSPRTGDELTLSITNYNGTNNDNNQARGNLIDIKGIKLFNVGRFDPPKYVFGLRFGYTHLLSSTQDQTPQKYRIYLGGEKDIRGFARKSINNNENGFTRAAHLAVENRFNDLLPYGLQPLFFIDFAKVGEENGFSDDVLYSPGIGLRWQSPFGSFRSTLAKGFIYNKTVLLEDTKEQINLFLSFGKEF
jgi:translocation and assembly module TamA